MAIEKRKQSTRLIFLFIYILLLFVINKLTFGSWLPESGDKGLWFYTASASILLGNFLVTPFFTKPVDSLSYAVMAGMGIYLVNSTNTWTSMDTIVFWITVSFIFFVLVSSLIAIATKDSEKEAWRKISATSMVISNNLGNHRVVFSSVFLFALIVFHRQSSAEMFFLSITWALLVVIEPDKHLWNLIERIKDIWAQKDIISVVGKIAAYQTPRIILLRQNEETHTEFGSLIAYKDSHTAVKIGLVLNYVGRDETLLLRALEIIVDDKTREKAIGLFKNQASNTAVKYDYFELNPNEKWRLPILNQLNDLIGIVDQGTTIERLEFEIINESDISEGRLVEVEINGEPVIYQIMDGLTKEDIVSQKNKYGYARGTANKIGKWKSESKKFESVQWLPKINTPVFLKTSKEPKPDWSTVGHFPKTNYNVKIKSISDLVTHNTAILGILGIGKSMLAIELVERMIAEKIKVVCIDLTYQYAQQLSDFHDPIWAKKSIEKIQEAGKSNCDNFQNDPKLGGSLPHLSKALDDDLQEFIHSDKRHYLKIYNPTELTGTKQTTAPKQYSEDGGKNWDRTAPLWDITPVEITSMITEITLGIVQDKMSSTARVCIVFEEAHSLVPEWSSAANEGDKTATNRTSRAILQGRKYGLGCLLITQRTANVTKTILNQCNSIFAMRTFDETGKSFLANYVGAEYSSKLSSLKARHAVYYGKSSSSENPVLIRLNDSEDFKKVFRAKFVPEEFETSETSQEDSLKKKVESLKTRKPRESSKIDVDSEVEIKEKTQLKVVTDKSLISEKNVIEWIESKPNLEQENDLKIGFETNNRFEQEEPIRYPIVKMPINDSFLKLPRNGRSGQIGFKESDFHELIRTKIPEIETNVEVHLSIPFFNKPYEPDIVLIDKSINLYVDIEIDEPYDGYYRYPTHVEGKDSIRDLFFNESGWVVIRFTERQIHLQPLECIAYIQDVLNSIRKYRIEESSNCISETQWDYQQALRWENEHYREKYLGIEKFGKHLSSSQIIVDVDEVEGIEENLSRTKQFNQTNVQDHIGFEEESHKYHHPKNTTGNADYISVTTLIDRFFPFNTARFIQAKAKREGLSEKEVLEEYERNRDEAATKGTNLHEQIENFLKGKKYNGDSNEFEMFKEFYQKIVVAKGFEFVEAEKRVLLERYNIAGTVDALFKKSNKDEYLIVDWKRSKKLVVDGHPKKYGYGYALSELSHLDNSSYYKYALQQNIYKYILENNYQMPISSMNLIVLHENFDQFYRINLVNMDKEVSIIFDSINHKI